MRGGGLRRPGRGLHECKLEDKTKSLKLPVLTRSGQEAKVTNSNPLQAHTWIGKYWLAIRLILAAYSSGLSIAAIYSEG
ncbi:hypothetical protein TUM22923_11020 [Polynucleobacter sp. TUM22923]|nr:hypothetical protein TUM22923_11020 [Polynucleobacter sp. TUM22923]